MKPTNYNEGYQPYFGNIGNSTATYNHDKDLSMRVFGTTLLWNEYLKSSYKGQQPYVSLQSATEASSGGALVFYSTYWTVQQG